MKLTAGSFVDGYSSYSKAPRPYVKAYQRRRMGVVTAVVSGKC